MPLVVFNPDNIQDGFFSDVDRFNETNSSTLTKDELKKHLALKMKL